MSYRDPLNSEDTSGIDALVGFVAILALVFVLWVSCK